MALGKKKEELKAAPAPTVDGDKAKVLAGLDAKIEKAKASGDAKGNLKKLQEKRKHVAAAKTRVRIRGAI